MLVHMQQVDDGRHQYHAAADAQEAHQHTDDKSQQENNRYHVIGLRYTYRRNGAGQAFPIFPCPAARGNIVWTSGDSEECLLFLFVRNLLYLHVFSRPPCGLLAPTGSGARMRAHPRKQDYVDPGQIEVKENEERNATHAN